MNVGFLKNPYDVKKPALHSQYVSIRWALTEFQNNITSHSANSIFMSDDEFSMPLFQAADANANLTPDHIR